MEALREIAQAVAPPKRMLGEERPVRLPAPGNLVVGHDEFRPAAAPEVLDAAQAAELLAVEPAAIEELAEKGELPGRKIGGEWRFSRSALLAWLGGS